MYSFGLKPDEITTSSRVEESIAIEPFPVTDADVIASLHTNSDGAKFASSLRDILPSPDKFTFAKNV